MKRKLIVVGLLSVVLLVGAVVHSILNGNIYISFDLESEKPFACQIFFSDDPGKPHKFNVTRNVHTGVSHVASKLDVKRLRRLRVDFGSNPGMVKAGPITLLVSGKQIPLDWHDFSQQNDIDSLAIDDNGFLTVISSKRDPYLTYAKDLDLSAAVAHLMQPLVCFSFAAMLAWILFSWISEKLQGMAYGRFISLFLAIQLSLAAVWMFFNLGVPTSFGDATDYLVLSRSLKVDEYRPIGYPVIIGCATWLSENIRLPYVFFVYIFQTVVSFFCTLFAVKTIDRLFLRDFLANVAEGFGTYAATAYLMTFPLCGMMNFAAMSDSLALSATLVFLAAILSVLCGEKGCGKMLAVVFVAFLSGSLVRGDRPYLFIVVGVAAAAICLIRSRPRRTAALKLMAVLALAFVATMAINRITQKPGCHNRPRTTFEFVLLDRIVWPHMTECYEDFPQEVRDVVTMKDAENFDANNNNVMYVFARNMNDRVGEKRAHELYREMAKTVWRTRRAKVAGEIAHDLFKVCFAPFFQVAEVYNVGCHKDSPCINPYCYNPRCFARSTLELTWALNAIPLHLFAVAFLVLLVLTLRSRERRLSLRNATPMLCIFFGFSLFLSIFYSLGDGAHPNSRYSLIVDSSWVVAMLSMLSAASFTAKAEI